MARLRSVLGRKILLLCLGGLTLGLAGSPRRYAAILRHMRRELRALEYEDLANAIRSLYRSKLINFQEGVDGTATITLTDRGERRALTYQISKMRIKLPARWDGKWRLVMFDIPERFKKARDALRARLKQIGFREFQRSVFIHPFECKNEIDFIIEFYQVRPWVRYAIVDSIDNEFHLKQKFRHVLGLV